MKQQIKRLNILSDNPELISRLQMAPSLNDGKLRIEKFLSRQLTQPEIESANKIWKKKQEGEQTMNSLEEIARDYYTKTLIAINNNCKQHLTQEQIDDIVDDFMKPTTILTDKLDDLWDKLKTTAIPATRSLQECHQSHQEI